MDITDSQKEQIVEILYTNWKGESGTRKIMPEKIWFGQTEWHKENQWLLHAWDLEKKEYRDFAMKDIEKWN